MGAVAILLLGALSLAVLAPSIASHAKAQDVAAVAQVLEGGGPMQMRGTWLLRCVILRSLSL